MALTATQFFVNLHVRNVKQSVAFFTGLGFAFDMRFALEEKSACIVIGEKTFVMLTTEDFFQTLTNKEIVDTNKHAQLTIAMFVESREKVDEIVKTAASLGGKIVTEPEDHGFMYQWGFQDLDGHLWAIGAE
ncbi:VOC family protein [Paenibacillus cymbidii]|uniref:VOC family protein n=1 Tax=Paenibacillus cymbidii TaxID=1639034 RepID=UPI001080A605|nr:VOC family protein [Paenibacillus cymbidii]